MYTLLKALLQKWGKWNNRKKIRGTKKRKQLNAVYMETGQYILATSWTNERRIVAIFSHPKRSRTKQLVVTMMAPCRDWQHNSICLKRRAPCAICRPILALPNRHFHCFSRFSFYTSCHKVLAAWNIFAKRKTIHSDYWEWQCLLTAYFTAISIAHTTRRWDYDVHF